MLNYNREKNPGIYYERQFNAKASLCLELEDNFKQYFKELEKKIKEQAIKMWNEV